jgi:hypothetical protein
VKEKREKFPGLVCDVGSSFFRMDRRKAEVDVCQRQQNIRLCWLQTPRAVVGRGMGERGRIFSFLFLREKRRRWFEVMVSCGGDGWVELFQFHSHSTRIFHTRFGAAILLLFEKNERESYGERGRERKRGVIWLCGGLRHVGAFSSCTARKTGKIP